MTKIVNWKAVAEEAGAPLMREAWQAIVLKNSRQGPGDVPDLFYANLTQRERDVLDLIGCGMSNEQIGAALGITARTVRAHLQALYGELGIEGRTRLALYAAGVLQPEAKVP